MTHSPADDSLDGHAITVWRQGDCVVEEQGFVHRFDPGEPLTDAARETQEGDLVESTVRGFVVISQTCDIVREALERPYLQVVPLVEVNEAFLPGIYRGERPRYAFVPGVAASHLVADLDRVMTVEKAVVAGWERIPGCTTDDEVRRFAEALARKYQRFAFPDDFNEMVEPLSKRLMQKHNRESEEGSALQALAEIRVAVDSAWDAPEVGVTFIFIRRDESVPFKDSSWDQEVAKWIGLIKPQGRFISIDGYVTTLPRMTAEEYAASDRLDLDRLSSPKMPA